MTVTFKNNSKNSPVKITFSNGESFILEALNVKTLDNINCSTFEVQYINDFSFGFFNEKSKRLREEITSKTYKNISKSIGNSILLIKLKYSFKESDNTLVLLFDKSYYLKTTEVDRLFRCIPILYYFGFAKSEKDLIGFISAKVINRDEFIRFYKVLFRIINIKNPLFGLFRYLYQIKRHKKFSDTFAVEDIFKNLFLLPTEKLEKEFSGLSAFYRQFNDILEEKIAYVFFSKLFKKISIKFKR